MNNYIILIVGWTLGQAAYACIKSWNIQRKRNDIDFRQALIMHFTKETAAFAFGAVMLLIALFIVSDYINLNVTKEELRNTEAAKWKFYLINFLRTISVFFGYLCQQLGYYIFGRSEKILAERSQKDGIPTEPSH